MVGPAAGKTSDRKEGPAAWFADSETKKRAGSDFRAKFKIAIGREKVKPIG